jgi:hypothetical protein
VARGARRCDDAAVTPARVLLAWLVLLAVGFSNGVLRQAGYARFFSDPTAHQLSAATFVVLEGVAIWLLTRRWPLASAAQAWRVGAAWLVLTFLFETGMGVAQGLPWSRIFGDYALWEGRLWPLLLAFILVAPRLAWAAHAGATRP